MAKLNKMIIKMIIIAKSHSISAREAEKIPTEGFRLYFIVIKGAKLCRFSRIQGLTSRDRIICRVRHYSSFMRQLSSHKFKIEIRCYCGPAGASLMVCRYRWDIIAGHRSQYDQKQSYAFHLRQDVSQISFLCVQAEIKPLKTQHS